MTITLRPRTVVLLLTAVLVFASTGSAVAGRLVTGRDIKDGSITNTDLKPGTLTSTALSPSLLAAITDTTSVNGQAGTPALAEVVQWSVTSPDPIPNTTNWATSFIPVGSPSVDTLPTNSRVTFINATAEVDTSTCTGEFRMFVYAFDDVTHQEFGIGGWGQLGPDYEESPEWSFGHTASDAGNMTLLTGDHPYHLAVKATCYSQGADNPIKRDIPPIAATWVMLVESLPTKAERILS